MRNDAHRWLIILGTVLGTAACTSSDTDPASTDVLDPMQPQFGKSIEEWINDYWKWVYETVPPSSCGMPVADATGELCDLGQDPNSPVFFLIGNFGGVTQRTECVVAEGKALFFRSP